MYCNCVTNHGFVPCSYVSSYLRLRLRAVPLLCRSRNFLVTYSRTKFNNAVSKHSLFWLSDLEKQHTLVICACSSGHLIHVRLNSFDRCLGYFEESRMLHILI
jgi:hypothetical protein